MCSDECRLLAKRLSKANYKKSDKGIESEKRWVASDARREVERKSRSKPKSKQLAVARSARCLANNPHLQERKRLRDVAYSKTEKGRLVNNKATRRYAKTESGRMTQKNAKHKRRALEAQGSVTLLEWKDKLEEHNGCCANCGVSEGIEMDHIHPISKGGLHHISNIQPLCRSCNASKGAKLEWVS